VAPRAGHAHQHSHGLNQLAAQPDQTGGLLVLGVRGTTTGFTAQARGALHHPPAPRVPRCHINPNTQDLACGSKSAGLARFVEAAGGEAARAALEQRAHDAGTAVFLSPPGGSSSSSSGSGGLGGAWGLLGLQQGLAQEHKQQGLALYWHMLEAMLRAEGARAGLSAAGERKQAGPRLGRLAPPPGSHCKQTPSICLSVLGSLKRSCCAPPPPRHITGALLTRWPFHQCLLACAFECVAAAHRCCGLSFPAIPVKLGLAPFELTKFIGPFVRAEPSLPRRVGLSKGSVAAWAHAGLA
jgi:hypothetical protein